MKPKANQHNWYNIALYGKATPKANHADIYLYGAIGGWRVNAQSFLDDLNAAGDLDTITVYLNTVGGTFYDGLPIYNTLKQHPASVTVKVMGYALSMGSVIMLAANKGQVEVAENAIVMVHPPQGWAYGDAQELRKSAAVLETHERALIPEYMRRMNKTESQVRQILQDETWYTGPEAIAAGLADRLFDAVDLDEAAEDMTTDSLEFAVENFQHPHPKFIEQFSNQLSRINPEFSDLGAGEVSTSSASPAANGHWFAQLFKAFVPSAPAHTDENDDMTQEQLKDLKDSLAANQQAMAENLTAAMTSALATAMAPPAEPELDEATRLANEVSALKDQLATAQAEKTALAAKVADLSTPAGDHTIIDENVGTATSQWSPDY